MHVESISLLVSMGNVIAKILVPDLSEKVMEDDRPGNPVAIIIAIDDNLLLILDSANNALRCFLKVNNTEGITDIPLI